MKQFTEDELNLVIEGLEHVRDMAYDDLNDIDSESDPEQYRRLWDRGNLAESAIEKTAAMTKWEKA